MKAASEKEGTMTFSIITPTIQRESLVRCCESVSNQTYTRWEHLVQIDRMSINLALIGSVMHPQRTISPCFAEHRNYGNTCRHMAWEGCTGDYLLYLDDDNYLADENVLSDLAAALVDRPDYACFPIMRFGQRFFDPNPRSCHADTANIVVKREYGRWPDRPEYTADGFWIDAMRSDPSLVLESFPDFRPIVIMPQQGKGL